MDATQNRTKPFDVLTRWIGYGQREAIKAGLRGEERAFFVDKLKELADIIDAMPETYRAREKGSQAVAFLHYFAGGSANWWIVEKDAGAPDDGPADFQSQAFGLANLFGGPADQDAELGYISIPEILAAGAELDLHWTPKTLADLRKKA